MQQEHFQECLVIYSNDCSEQFIINGHMTERNVTRDYLTYTSDSRQLMIK